MNTDEQEYDIKKRKMYWYMKQLFQDSDCDYKDRCANAKDVADKERME